MRFLNIILSITLAASSLVTLRAQAQHIRNNVEVYSAEKIDRVKELALVKDLEHKISVARVSRTGVLAIGVLTGVATLFFATLAADLTLNAAKRDTDFTSLIYWGLLGGDAALGYATYKSIQYFNIKGKDIDILKVRLKHARERLELLLYQDVELN